MRHEAISRHDASEVDTTDSRNEENSEYHAKVGKLAEVVVYNLFESSDVPVEYADTWETDLLVGADQKRIDVKVRDRLETWGSDLLVRDRPGVGLNSDAYVSVIVEDLTKAVITGYASRRQVRRAQLFDKARTHRTRIIEEDDLKDISQLIAYARN
jgi:hypothetical protein